MNPTTNFIEPLEKLSYMTMDFFTEDFNMNQYAPLYKEDSNAKIGRSISGTSKNEDNIFTKGEIDILFQIRQKKYKYPKFSKL